MPQKDQELLLDLSKQSLVSHNNSNVVNVQNEIKFLLKRLKLKEWKVVINNDSLSLEMLKRFNLVIIYMPKLKYNEMEFECLKAYLEHNGGHLMILLEEGGGQLNACTNVNYFTEEYGISINNDRVIRTSFYKYYNPKEVHIQDGIVNRALLQHVSKLRPSKNRSSITSLAYVYPFGATVNVAKPSVAVLSTGTTSFPPCRPTCAFYHSSQGKMIVFGSGHCFTDKYINKEDNLLILDLFFSFFSEASFSLNTIDALNPEVMDYHMVPDLEVLCNKPLLFLEENEDIPLDYSHLFSRDIKKISNRSLINVNKAFDEFQIEKRSLRLIKPYFETPLPQLVPAVYAPIFRALTKPELELYDLDNEFSSIQNKLTKLANKCGNNDLDYFIRECGIIVGLSLNYSDNIPKNILSTLASKLVGFKRTNPN